MSDGDSRLALARVNREVHRFGLLPFTDSTTPSLVSIVAGRTVAGSWWGDPAGHLIYQVGESIESAPDVLIVQLWRRKRTLIHRRLWPALVRIGRARASWQTESLTRIALGLLDRIESEKLVRGDQLPPDFPPGTQSFRAGLRELERRLLILTRSVHTASGAHAMEAESWKSWASRTGVARFIGSVATAESEIEDAARRLKPETDPRRAFPWGRSPRRRF